MQHVSHRKKKKKKKYLPTLPNVFPAVTRTTQLFFFGLTKGLSTKLKISFTHSYMTIILLYGLLKKYSYFFYNENLFANL